MPSLVHSTVLIMEVRILLDAWPSCKKAFDFGRARVVVCGHRRNRLFRSSFQSVQVPRIKAGRIGKRVRIPRGRATVKHRQSEVMQSQETCQNAIAVLNARERCSGRPRDSDLKKIPSLPVHFAWQEVTGFWFLQSAVARAAAEEFII